MIGNRYRIIDALGKGGMGVVSRVSDRLTGDILALKQVRLADLPDETDDYRLALANEFEVMASLRHPHIISVLDYGFDNERLPYFTMPLLANAQTILDAGAGQPLEFQLRLLVELLQALIYLHRRGVIHRDLKPNNVLVTGGRVLVVDFGLAVLQRGSSLDNSSSGGTLTHIAPELLLGDPPSFASDLYAVGIMAHELLLGRHPFDITNPAQLITDVLHTPIRVISPDLPPALGHWIEQLVQKDSAERYPSAAVAYDALLAAADLPPQPETSAIRASFLQAATFVGRETEREQLLEAAVNARQGEGSTWLIGGESGVGKSRLIDEVRIRALVEGMFVLRGQSVETGGQPYHLWRDVLRRLALVVPLDETDIGILQTLIPDIETLVGQAGQAPTAADGMTMHERLKQAIVRVFRHNPQPTLLILEDLHWLSESVDIVKQLTQVAADLPLLIIGTYRDDERPELPKELPLMQPLKLERLNDSEIAQLSQAVLGEGGADAELVERLRQETEGNVFFLVETVRALAETAGQLRDVINLDLPAQIFAGGVQEIIERRLQRIPGSAQPLLKLAAIAGRQLDLHVMTYLSGSPVDDWLMAAAGVLEVNENQWRFAHDKLRERVLADLAPVERPILHRQVAEALEAVYPDDLSYAAVLGEHYALAGDGTRMMVYLRPAVERFRAIADYRSMERVVKLALSVDIPTVEDRLWLQLQQAYAVTRQGRYPEAQVLYDALLPATREAGLELLEGETLGDLAWLQQELGHYDEALADQGQAIAIFERLGALEELGAILSERGITLTNRGQHADALVILKRGEEIFADLGSLQKLGQINNSIGITTWYLGDYDGARVRWTTALAIFEEIGFIRGIANASNNLGIMLRHQNDLDGAEAYFAKALELYKNSGDRHSIANIINSFGQIERMRKNYPQALHHYHESLALYRQLKIQRAIAGLLHNIGKLLEDQGDFAAAQPYYEESLGLSRQANDQPNMVMTLLQLARIDIHAGLSEVALSKLREVLSLRAKATDLTLLILVAVAAEHRLALGDAATAGRWAAFVESHPKVDQEVRDLCFGVLAQLTPEQAAAIPLAHPSLEEVLAEVSAYLGE